MLTATACEYDDDGGIARVYELCSPEYIFLASEKMNTKPLPLETLSTDIRSYISAEFAGFGIKSSLSFETAEGQSFTEVIMDNDGLLLFDAEGLFICGDDSFIRGTGDDDDEEYGGDDDDEVYGDDDDE